MANQNSIADLSTTSASNTNWKGQSIVGAVQLAMNLDEAERNISAMLAAMYDSLGGVATVSGTNTLTVTITEDWAALADGLLLAIKTPNANTGAVTLNPTVPTVGALGAKAIRLQGDTALSGGEMVAKGIYLLRYDSTYNSSAGAWVLLNGGGITLPLGATSGGTGQSTYTQGDLLYASVTNVLSKLGKGTTGQVLSQTSTVPAWGGAITLGSPTASTSGTSIDITGIPSGVKRITLILSGVSTTGTSSPLIQIGSGSVTTSGYVGAGSRLASAGVATAASTAGLVFNGNNASSTIGGIVTFDLLSSAANTWAGNVVAGDSTTTFVYVGGTAVTLSGALDRIRLTTVGGTDTFDAGSINLMYEF